MKKIIFVSSLMLVSAIAMATKMTASAGATVTTPTYLSVKGFKDCLSQISNGTSTSYCLPAKQPKACANDSWKALVADKAFSSKESHCPQ